MVLGAIQHKIYSDEVRFIFFVHFSHILFTHIVHIIFHDVQGRLLAMWNLLDTLKSTLRDVRSATSQPAYTPD